MRTEKWQTFKQTERKLTQNGRQIKKKKKNRRERGTDRQRQREEEEDKGAHKRRK